MVAVAGTVAGGLAALGAHDDIDAAVRAATDGLDELGGDDEAARALLTEAAEAFESAESTLRAWWARPALVVPGVAQQSRAVSTMASSGAHLARTAVDASRDADLEAVRPRDGTVDLVALADLREPLEQSLSSLRSAADRLDGARSPLLLPPVADRLADLRDRVEGALGSAELGVQAVEVAPGLLGADGPRRYFLAFHNPAELRGIGGFMGSWAEMVVDGGRFELTHTGRVRELTTGGPDPEGRRIEGEAEFVARYGQAPARYWGLIGFSPDFPTVARIIEQLYPQSGGEAIDGVIALTPRAFAAFLELTGPIAVPGYPERLTPENAERILLHEQYLVFPRDSNEDRTQFLADATEVLFDELMTGELPGPSGLARDLGPVVDSRDLMLWAARDAERALIERIGATGSVERSDADSFGVVTQNYGGNKIDWFLRRDLRYEVDWDPATGDVDATLTVTLENRAPADGLPQSVIGWGGDLAAGQLPVADGENLMVLSAYTTYPIRSVTLDGVPVAHELGTELGHEVARLVVSIPAGQTRTVQVETSGRVTRGARYLLHPLRQPSVEPDAIEVEVELPPGWVVGSGAGASNRVGAAWTADQRASLQVDAGVDASGDPGRSLLDRLHGG
jgi:hypothetical protein